MIREAVVRYINAWASVLEARAQKVRCPHKWEEVQEFQRYHSAADPDDLLSVTYLYVCTSCGEHKKITMP